MSILLGLSFGCGNRQSTEQPTDKITKDQFGYPGMKLPANFQEELAKKRAAQALAQSKNPAARS